MPLNASSTPHLQVLLATYNGERFLAQQIDSILAQDYPDFTILASDDGSKDNTLAILQEYEARFPNRMHVLPSAKTGNPKWNFMRLMEASTAPYVAFCDQDDVWLPNRLSLTMQRMQQLVAQYGDDSPLLVFTDLEVVNENLQSIAPSLWQRQSIAGGETRLPRLIAQNNFTGNTGLLNRALVQKALPIPAKATMHDWWVMLVASIFGQMAAIATPTVRYRQHSSNVLGAVEDTPRKLIPGFREHGERRKEWEMTERQAEALIEQYGDALPADKRRIIEAYIRCETSPSRIVRVATLIRYGFFRTRLRMNLAVLWYLWDMKAAKRGES